MTKKNSQAIVVWKIEPLISNLNGMTLENKTDFLQGTKNLVASMSPFLPDSINKTLETKPMTVQKTYTVHEMILSVFFYFKKKMKSYTKHQLLFIIKIIKKILFKANPF